MLPDGAHMRSEDWTVFFLNQTIEETEKSSQRKDEGDVEEKPLLYVLNLVRTKHDVNARRYLINLLKYSNFNLIDANGVHL
jgi:hypothetical protein